VIRAMPRHEGIARDTVKGGADHRPLNCGLLSAAFCLLGRKRDHRAQSDIHMQTAGFDEDAAPDRPAALYPGRNLLPFPESAPLLHRAPAASIAKSTNYGQM
jgi:hypothetical protein